jgi:hypothetical protein
MKIKTALDIEGYLIVVLVSMKANINESEDGKC